MVVGQVLPVGGPRSDRPRDGLDLTIEARLEIEYPQWGVLIFGFGDHVAAVRGGREGVAAVHARRARDGGKQLGLLRVRHVEDVIATAARSVENRSEERRVG